MPLNAQSATRKDTATGRSVSLQHRHFAFIAATIAQVYNMNDRQAIAELFADACAGTNPKFSRARFLAACNLDRDDIDRAVTAANTLSRSALIEAAKETAKLDTPDYLRPLLDD